MRREHGAAEPVDPNLTSMLDLVLNLLMFFIATSNLVQEQVTADVVLPLSQSAQPLSVKRDRDPLFVNLIVDLKTNEHTVRVAGGEDLSQSRARNWLAGRYEDIKRNLAADEEVPNPVIIRAHKDSDYVQVYQLMRACADAGFRNLKVRALTAE